MLFTNILMCKNRSHFQEEEDVEDGECDVVMRIVNGHLEETVDSCLIYVIAY